VRLATWNVNSILARLPRLVEWLDDTGPDVVCLQETKCANDAFPAEEIERRGYEIVAHGDGRWNGVAVLSRIGITHEARGFPGQPGFAGAATDDGDDALFAAPSAPVVEARAVGALCGPMYVWSVYVPNGRTVDSPHYAYKLEWLRAFGAAVAHDIPDARPWVMCGDFNIAPTDDDVWDPAAFVGSTHVTEAERAALASLRKRGLTDVFPRPLKYDHPFTYWDYRAGMFHKNLGMRIDLVYANAKAAAAVTDAYVDREARKGKGPSDHAPVVVDLDL
jgi:exodeoxyribonuclease-3